MALQICKSCGKSIDSGLVICPTCGCPPSKEKEQELSPEQTKQIAKGIRKEFVLTIITWLGVLSLIFGIGLWQAYQSATKQLQNLLVDRIAHEFEQPKIREIVHDVAAKSAKNILEHEIQPEVVKFKKEIGSDLKTIQGMVNSAQTQLSDLTTLIEVEDAARYGSRAAFSQLIQLGTRSNSFGAMAQRRISMIYRDLSIYKSVPGAYFGLSFTVNGKKVGAKEVSTHDLFLHLESPHTPKEHIPSLMAHISDKPKKEVCKEAIRIFESSDSLVGSAATCGILAKILGPKGNYLAFDEWLEVCKVEVQQGHE